MGSLEQVNLFKSISNTERRHVLATKFIESVTALVDKVAEEHEEDTATLARLGLTYEDYCQWVANGSKDPYVDKARGSTEASEAVPKAEPSRVVRAQKGSKGAIFEFAQKK